LPLFGVGIKKERLKIGMVHKQQAIFVSMLVVGGGLAAASLLPEHYLVGEGIAFILVGLTGLLMSWTTFDIGAGIKEVVREVGRENNEVVREVGRENKKALDSLAESIDRMADTQRMMVESQKETREMMAESQRMMAESQKETREMMAESQKETREMMAESMNRISESQDNIARLLERVAKNTGAVD